MFQWDDKYLLGDVFIDGEHQILFKLANKITAEKGTIPHEELVKYLSMVVEYSTFHFKHEEYLMKETKWDGYEHHAEIHKQIIKEMNETITSHGTITQLQIKLSHFLNKWIVEHVVLEDQKFRIHLTKTKGFMRL